MGSLNQEMTSFAMFRPSTRTFCHTFYVLNSTSIVLLMEFIVCIPLDKTAFYQVLHCQLSHLMMLVLAVHWQFSFFGWCLYVSMYLLHKKKTTTKNINTPPFPSIPLLPHFLSPIIYYLLFMHFIAIARLSHKPSWAGCISCRWH